MLYVISGCSCGGKTTLINALASHGHEIAREPGRDIVRSEMASGGSSLPWTNPEAFAIRCIELSIQRYEAARLSGGIVFFDRSLIDAVSALIRVKSEKAEHYSPVLDEYRYADTVFMATPWPEIFENDSERKHTFEESAAEYERLVCSYVQSGYSIKTVPQVSVPERVSFILQHIT